MANAEVERIAIEHVMRLERDAGRDLRMFTVAVCLTTSRVHQGRLR